MDSIYRNAGFFLAAVALTLGAHGETSRAEEITLQDGKKLNGSIVGFENGMFKVETDFGFVLIRKDKVKNISQFPAAAKARAGLPQPDTSPPKPAAPAPAVAAVAEVPKPPPPPPAPVSRPLNEPLPSKIRARVEGTSYINETFMFTFYKPPGWKIQEEAPRETGRAIVAIGPPGEHTILFVERQVWSGEPDLKSDATEANLRATYRDYRKILESAVEVDGRPAIRKEFEGVLDGALWRGVALRVAQQNTVFGVIGLTSAETIEFHEAVLNKILKSFRFLRADEVNPAKTSQP